MHNERAYLGSFAIVIASKHEAMNTSRSPPWSVCAMPTITEVCNQANPRATFTALYNFTEMCPVRVLFLCSLCWKINIIRGYRNIIDSMPLYRANSSFHSRFEGEKM